MAAIETSSGQLWLEATTATLQEAIRTVHALSRGGTVWLNTPITLERPIRMHSGVAVDARNVQVTAHPVNSSFIFHNCENSRLENVRLYRPAATAASTIVLSSSSGGSPTQNNILNNIHVQHSESTGSDTSPTPGNATALLLHAVSGGVVSGNSVKNLRAFGVLNGIALESVPSSPGILHHNMFAHIYVDGFATFISFEGTRTTVLENHFLNVRGVQRTGMTAGIGPVIGSGNYFDHVQVRRTTSSSDNIPDLNISSDADRTYVCAYSLASVVNKSTSTVFSHIMDSGTESCTLI